MFRSPAGLGDSCRFSAPGIRQRKCDSL